MNTRTVRDHNVRAYVAEFLGTFFLILGGTSAILGVTLARISGSLDAGQTVSAFGAGNVVIPLAFGLTLVVAVFSLGHISGAHFNPAVSIAFAVRRHFAWAEVPPYIAAQLLGAVAASGVLALCFGSLEGFTTGETVPSPGLPLYAVFVYEFVATFLLMFVITSVATDAQAEGVPAGLAIGFTVAAMAFATGWVGGGSFNPARTLGPALIGGVWTGLWIYLTAPVLGAIAGVTVYDAIRAPEADEDPIMRDPTLS